MRLAGSFGTIGEVEDEEATTLMLEALFDIRAAVYEIHDVVVWNDEDEDAEEEEENDA